MEVYREIPLIEALADIAQGGFDSLYCQKLSNGELVLAEKYDFKLKEIKEYKWFKCYKDEGDSK